MRNCCLKLGIAEPWLVYWNNMMTSNQASTPNINNVFSLFSNGEKLALYNEKPFLDVAACPHVEQKSTSSLASIDNKYDLVILDNLKKTSDIFNFLSKTTEQGCTIILLKNKTLKEKLFIASRIISLCLRSRKYHLMIKGYFVHPNYEAPSQVVSCHKHLSQQHFHKYYHWQYNENSTKAKRFFKHIVYALNAFYFTEDYFIFWIAKNAK